MAREPARYRVKGTKLYIRPGRGMQAYEAAGTGRRARFWHAPRVGPNAALERSLPALRGRSRQADRNDGMAASAIDGLATEMVGTGLKPKFRTPDRNLNRELARLWADWTDEADADGRLDFYGLQGLLARSVVAGGDAFIRLRLRQPGDMATVPLQLQLLESEFCPDELTMPFAGGLAAGNEISQGVEFNIIGQRVAYWLYRRHPGDRNGNWFLDSEAKRVPASEVLHCLFPRRPGQIRGEPWLSRALITLRDLDLFQDATLKRQQAASMIAGFVTEPADDTFGGDDSQEEDEAESGVLNVKMEPGTLIGLEPGQEITFNNPPDAGTTYDPFTTWQLRYIAASIGILYEQLTGDYTSANDRQYRAAINAFRRRCEMWQFHMPILWRWLDLAILAGKIQPRGLSDAELRRVDWIGQKRPYIHPVQDVQADIAAVRAGFTARADIVSGQGDDVEDVDERQAQDNARADEAGLAHDSDGRRPAKGGAAPEPDGGGDGGRQDEGGEGEQRGRPDA